MLREFGGCGVEPVLVHTRSLYVQTVSSSKCLAKWALSLVQGTHTKQNNLPGENARGPCPVNAHTLAPTDSALRRALWAAANVYSLSHTPSGACSRPAWRPCCWPGPSAPRTRLPCTAPPRALQEWPPAHGGRLPCAELGGLHASPERAEC